MIEALIGGEKDASVLADLAQKKLREKIPQLQRALEGEVTGPLGDFAGRYEEGNQQLQNQGASRPERAKRNHSRPAGPRQSRNTSSTRAATSALAVRRSYPFPNSSS